MQPGAKDLGDEVEYFLFWFLRLPINCLLNNGVHEKFFFYMLGKVLPVNFSE